ncbi:MDIS1-interacting receptor like kinase 2-like [Gossypium hirsutum]|uniref:non-specific serine/threonine protein kinase n=1 Tax=Gossypium hirsutum TaxID=3635 RepID=A0A1U8KHJ5_GOSHI|nr:MDIS1-interacting receptor like kinase 2-like [Gossypium hirsutum]
MNGSLLAELQVKPSWIEQIKGEQLEDESLGLRFRQIEGGSTTNSGLNSDACVSVGSTDFCSHPKHSFLVYELVERGSLRMVLSNNEHAKELDWKKRLNVVKGLANALYYMHHDQSQHIVHRDISSNNVLLDLDYEARVSDFGSARILKPNSVKILIEKMREIKCFKFVILVATA